MNRKRQLGQQRRIEEQEKQVQNKKIA